MLKQHEVKPTTGTGSSNGGVNAAALAAKSKGAQALSDIAELLAQDDDQDQDLDQNDYYSRGCCGCGC